MFLSPLGARRHLMIRFNYNWSPGPAICRLFLSVDNRVTGMFSFSFIFVSNQFQTIDALTRCKGSSLLQVDSQLFGEWTQKVEPIRNGSNPIFESYTIHRHALRSNFWIFSKFCQKIQNSITLLIIVRFSSGSTITLLLDKSWLDFTQSRDHRRFQRLTAIRWLWIINSFSNQPIKARVEITCSIVAFKLNDLERRIFVDFVLKTSKWRNGKEQHGTCRRMKEKRKRADPESIPARVPVKMKRKIVDRHNGEAKNGTFPD